MLEVLVGGPFPQIGFITEKTVIPFEEGCGTGDCKTSFAIDGTRGHVWYGGPASTYPVAWPMYTLSEEKCIIGISVDLDARRLQHFYDKKWHNISLPDDFSFDYKLVLPSLTGSGSAFRVLCLEFGQVA